MESEPLNPSADPTQMILASQRGAIASAIGSLDADPEKAARSVELSEATGVPAPVINANLEGFEQQHKAALTANLLNNNEYLRTFINSNPMAAKIANDDYANLDEVSQRISSMHLGFGSRLAETAKTSFSALFNPPESADLAKTISPEDLKNYPFLSAMYAGLGTPINMLLAGMQGDIEAVTKGTEKAGTAVGGEQFGREMAGLVEAEAMGMTGRHGGPELHAAADKLKRIQPYIDSGREPPPTIIPEYDDFRAKQNVEDVGTLNDATKAAQSSALRERSPELFRQYVAQHVGDHEIGVSGEVVAQLYGDKLPTPDDNLLGWVPGIEDKLNLARATGDDVKIPLADWIARVDPEVEKVLKDDIRVHPNGITTTEAKIQKEMEKGGDLVVARRMGDGSVVSGQPGQIHGDLISPEELNATPFFPPPTDSMGFADKSGKFLSREEAYDHVKTNEPGRLKPEAHGPHFQAEHYINAKLEPAEPLPELVPSTRAASALEPMFSVGDRKLELERIVRPIYKEQPAWMGDVKYHDFSINDEKGSPVGTINLSEQKGGKQLYVEMINGIGGLGPRDFGPSLMRDLLRQLKQEFPDAESITGHRVSGAREKAGSYMAASASPVVKLDNPNIEDLNRVLEGGHWEQFSKNVNAYIKPYAERNIEDRRLIDAIGEELDRIVPNKLRIQEASWITAQGVEGQGSDLVHPTGTYVSYKDAYPIILYALDGENALGTARHEAIHHLRNYGFFKPEEWSSLEKAVVDNRWIDQFRIEERYPNLSPALRREEAIADAFKEWSGNRDFQVTPEAHTLFERMKQFFDALKERIGQLLGKDPSWEDVFKRVDAGEVGAREGTEPLDARAFNEKLSVPEDPQGGSRVFERAAALGMTTDQFRRYDELIQQRHAEDIAAATKRAQEEQAREHTKQWKEDRKALRQEVAADIRQRPDVAADLFFGSGELYGKKVPLGSVKLDASALTPEQKAGLPRQYYGEHGLHPDDVANLFGYGSGDVLVERLVQYNAAKLQAGGMSAKDFVSRVTDIETDRQMQVKHGSLEDNVADAVKEQVSGEVQQNILHEETVALGMKAGQAPLDKATVVGQLREAFAKMPLGSVDSDAYMRAAGKAGRQAELSLLANDPANAFKAKQQQYYATVIANEASKLENQIAKFDKTAKRFTKREVPSVDQEYTNFIHDILMRVGRPVRRSVQDLEGEIAAGEYHSLQSFVEGKNGFYLREVAVADHLLDPGFRKAFDDLTVDEFRGTDMSIRSLVANGRDEKKITKAGTAEDLAVVKAQMIEQLKAFEEKEFDAKGGRAMGPLPPKSATALRTYGIDHLQMETIFNRWDKGDPKGVFQQYVLRDLVDASNSESAKRKVYAGRLLELDDKADLKKSVDNPLFKAPGTEQLLPLIRGNLRAVLLNAGNDSNLTKMAKGYNIPKEQLTAWLHQHTTKEDWDWAQKMGDIFADLKKEADVMYRNVSGVAPESIKLDPVDTPHGQYPGWYYPLIAHPEFEGGVKKMMGKDALEQEGFVRATTANGYTKARTGATYPLALDLDMLPYRMGQMIHDVEMRPAVINASKIFYDKDVRQTIANRFGHEWRDMMVPYLVDVANAANYTTKAQKEMASWSEFFRQNLITTLVGLNPGTFLKHTPTALVQSIQEVGSDRFLQAVRGLWSVNERTGESNWKFAKSTSQELQRRHSHFMETLGGAADTLIPKSGFDSLRQTVNYYASSPVAMGDLASAVPTWLAQYTKSIEEGETHGDAAYFADRAVRRAHGSTAITNRSAVMRGGSYSPWLASVYGFFNHIMNRQYEAIWQAGDTLDLVKNKEGTYVDAMKGGQKLTGQLWAYVIAPAIIEEILTPQVSADGDSWGKKAAKSLTFTLGASWVGIRDLTNAMLNGRDPTLGLAGTALKSITDVFRDVTKDRPLSKEHAGKLIRDASALVGTSTGLMPAQVGRVAQFGFGVEQGTERPKGPWGWLTGARYGTIKGHPATGADWWRHHVGGR